MRVTSYNILDGGIGRGDPLAEILLAARGDIFVLVEADDETVLAHLAKRLGADFIAAPGDGHTVAVLSRWPIVQTVNHALLVQNGPRSLVEAVVRHPDGREISIFGLHLSARAYEENEQTRLAEVDALLRITQMLCNAGRPHVLAGDFNSNSPVQDIDIAKCKAKTREAYAANGNRIPRRVIQRLLDAGYVDTLAATKPEAAKTAATFTTHEPGQRVDYIFAFGLAEAAVADAWVEQDRLATYASDHYPVGAELHV